MHKQIFFLSIALLAYLQLSASSSSSNCATTQTTAKNTSQEKLITTFLTQTTPPLTYKNNTNKEIIAWKSELKKNIPHEIKRLERLLTEKKDTIESLAQWELWRLWRCCLMLQNQSDLYKIYGTPSALEYLENTDMEMDILPYAKKKLPALLALLSGLSKYESVNIEKIKNTANLFFISRIDNLSKEPRKTSNNSYTNNNPLQKNITLEQEQNLLNALNKAAKEIIIKHSDSSKDNSESSAFTDDPYERLEAIDAIIDSGNSDSDDDSSKCTHQ